MAEQFRMPDWFNLADYDYCRSLERASVGILYESYRAWCKASGHYPMSRKRFSQKLAERGFEKTRTSEERYFVGIGLKAEIIKLPLSVVKGDGPR